MRNINKRLTSFFTSIVMLFAMVGVFPKGNGNVNTLQVHAATYSPSAAVAYAQQYAYNYNSQYHNFNPDGGDCANFVSQCLYAGGLQMTDGWYYNGNASNYNRSTSWTYCPAMYNYFKSAGYTIIENPSSDQVYVGNPMLYWNSSKGRWGHAGICTGRSSNGTPLVLC